MENYLHRGQRAAYRAVLSVWSALQSACAVKDRHRRLTGRGSYMAASGRILFSPPRSIRIPICYRVLPAQIAA